MLRTGAEVTLHRVMVHTIVDLQRHAGHADIIRELFDGSAGLLRNVSNLPSDMNWLAYTAKLTAIAEQFELNGDR
jgi:hypothetical protein